MSDILERAKDADLDLLAIADWGKTKDLFGELIAEVERLQNLIDKPPEEADWKADMDFVESEMGSRPYPAIVATTYKWLKAYRKAQNSNLIRRQQNKRLEEERALYVVPGSALEAALSWIEELKNYNKRLEKAFLKSEIRRVNNPDNNHSWYPGDESYVDFVNRVKREAEQNAREALERIKEGGRDEN